MRCGGQEIADKVGQVSILCNNAGINRRNGIHGAIPTP